MPQLFTVDELLNYAVLGEPVKKIITELPRPLPAPFYNQTANALGDRFRRVTFRGTRKAAKVVPYGAPPLNVQKTAVGAEEVVMLHSYEQITAGPEILKLFHGYQDYQVQLGAIDELNRQAEDFGNRQGNLRTTAVHSFVTFGKIWIDINGNVLLSSSGAVDTVDYRIPSGNVAAFGTAWSDTTADIPGMVMTLQQTATRTTGRPLVYAIYGKNAPGYMAKNTAMQAFLSRIYAKPDVQQFWINNQTIPTGLLDLTWVPGKDIFFQADDGTLTSYFPDDQITFLPAMGRDAYVVREGSYPVPTKFAALQTSGDFEALIRECINNPVYGAFRYAYGIAVPTPQIMMVQGDTFLPDMKVADSMYIYDVTP